MANKLKEGIFIIEITKVVAHRLHDGYGVPWRDGGISTTFGNSKRKKYFLCESKKNLSFLSKVMTEENM